MHSPRLALNRVIDSGHKLFVRISHVCDVYKGPDKTHCLAGLLYYSRSVPATQQGTQCTHHTTHILLGSPPPGCV